MKRINPNKPFLRSYENQKNIRTSFYEEFKICGFNLILMLFESVTRVLTTVEENQSSKGDPKGLKGASTYNNKNYKRFLESRTKKVDQFIVNCIGWAHVLRSIEVIEMSVRDLVYKIVPTTAINRDLKTSQGKTLTKDSEYTLLERKKEIMIGK